MFIVGIGAITFALVEAPEIGFGSPLIIGSVVLSLVVLVVFVRFELRSDDPMMDVRVFSDRAVHRGHRHHARRRCSAPTERLLVITQYFQNIRDYSARGCRTADVVLLRSVDGVRPHRRSPGGHASVAGDRRLVGLALVTIGSATLAFSAGRSLVITCVGLFLLGCGVGLSVSPATAMAMATISPERSGMASGILSTQRALGSTAGFAVMGSILALVVADAASRATSKR